MSLVFALNHMTTPKLKSVALMELAASLGCKGVEFRNDFTDRALFDGLPTDIIVENARVLQQEIFALSEIKMFNRWDDRRAKEAENLMTLAQAAGISSVSLIPANDGQGLGNGERQAHLRVALRELSPMLEAFDLIGNVEPLGFPTSSVRAKPELIDAIEAISNARFRIVHDTFHHALSGDQELFPNHTAIVHISGVVNPDKAIEDFQDADRVLVGAGDRLGNIAQIRSFVEAGWNGAFSFEAFATEIHELDDPKAALLASINFINEQVGQRAA